MHVSSLASTKRVPRPEIELLTLVSGFETLFRSGYITHFGTARHSALYSDDPSGQELLLGHIIPASASWLISMLKWTT